MRSIGCLMSPLVATTNQAQLGGPFSRSLAMSHLTSGPY
jgi:hypothetical protein